MPPPRPHSLRPPFLLILPPIRPMYGLNVSVHEDPRESVRRVFSVYKGVLCV